MRSATAAALPWPLAWSNAAQRCSILLLALVPLCLGMVVRAQGVDIAIVVRDPMGRALEQVEVAFPSLKRTALTDASGAARFSGVDSGTYALRVRKVGFAPTAQRIQLRANAATTITLEPLLITLDTVRSVERCPWRGYSGFECRQRQDKGLFLDLATIDSANVGDVALLFYGRADFRVGRALRTGIPYVTSKYKGGRCITVLVNGLPANTTTNRLPRYAREIVAVEAYANPQDVPKGYEQFTWTTPTRCGMVNYWTSRR